MFVLCAHAIEVYDAIQHSVILFLTLIYVIQFLILVHVIKFDAISCELVW